MEQKKPLILDLALGRDSYFAAMAAIRSEKVDLKAITVGDYRMDRAVHGMLHLLQHMFLEIPVCKGEKYPLRAGEKERQIEIDPFAGRWPEDPFCETPAVNKMEDLILTHLQKTSIFACSSLTNVAKLLLTKPEVRDKIEQIIIPESRAEDAGQKGFPEEPQIDPEAADVILKSGVPVLFLPYKVLTPAPGNQAMLEAICGGTDNMIGRFLRHASIPKEDAWVPILCGLSGIAAVTDPDRIRKVPGSVRAETKGTLRGRYCLNYEAVHSAVRIAEEIDYSCTVVPGFGVMDTPELLAWDEQNKGRNPHHHG